MTAAVHQVSDLDLSENLNNISDFENDNVFQSPNIRIRVTSPSDDEHSTSYTLGQTNRPPTVSGSYMPECIPDRFHPCLKVIKTTMFVIFWCVCCWALIEEKESVQIMQRISIPKGLPKGFFISECPDHEQIRIFVEGAFLPHHYANMSPYHMEIWVQLIETPFPHPNASNIKDTDIISLKNTSTSWRVPLVPEELVGRVPEIFQEKLIELQEFDINCTSRYFLKIMLSTNLKSTCRLSLGYNLQPINVDLGIIYATLILLGLYVLIIFEIIHRTLAAMIASTMSVAILAALDARPSLAEIIGWIDMETVLLLFSMMTLVTIFGETGVFDYLAVLAYKLTRGKIWPLINILCLFTALVSCFLDNVTTALLMTPVTIRLCDVMKLNPIPVLICMIIFSNIGGALTPVGDPPNVIIASNAAVMRSGVTFAIFTLHMGIGVAMAAVTVYVQIRFIYRNIDQLRVSEPLDVQETLRRDIAVWRKAAASVSSFNQNEDALKDALQQTTRRLQGRLQAKKSTASSPHDNYAYNLEDLRKRYPIKDFSLLIKASCTLLFLITAFFLHSIPEMSSLGIGWTALLGALLLLILYDKDDLEIIFSRIEWPTLIFFASLFILMEALSRLGLIDWIGRQTLVVIMSVEQESRLAVAILLILWVSAIASAFVDNIPLTTMMIRIATRLAENEELGLPLQPLVWSLAFGACLGGNGTLFGSSSNIVCAGVAEQHGYRFSFMEYFKIGFPVMLTSLVTVTVYLLIAHVYLGWNY